MSKDGIRIGAAKVKITPPKNVPMSGYSGRKEGSAGVHDHLFARAMVFDNGKTRAGVLVADLIGLPIKTTRQVRDMVSEQASIPRENLIVASTHTHGGPDTEPQPDCNANHERHAAYLEKLPGLLADTVVRASKRTAGGKLVFGRAVETNVSSNRRVHLLDGRTTMDWRGFGEDEVAFRGPIDPGVRVLASLGSGKRVRAALVNFPCHATVMGGNNRLITADWPGAAYRNLEERLGGRSFAMVAQGACANLNPKKPRDEFEVVEKKGRLIAEAADRAIQKARPVEGGTIAGIIAPLKLPRKKHQPNTPAEGDPFVSLGDFRRQIREEMEKEPQEDWELELQVVRVGDIVFVGIPGEEFVQIGMRIRGLSEFQETFVVGYACSYEPGYVPIAAAYQYGVYEVRTSKVAPGADEIVISAAKEAMDALATRE